MWVLLPVKNFRQAKRRLAPVLSNAERQALVSIMLEDMLAILTGNAQIEGVFLLSDDPEAGLLADRFSVIHVTDSQFEAEGLNNALQKAVNYLAEQGITEVMIIPGDLPLINDAEINQLLAAHNQIDEAVVTLVTDRRGEGSNAIICNPRSGFRFCFGPNSAVQHQQQAIAIGAVFNRVELPGIGCDIDCPQDLLDMEQHYAVQHSPEGRLKKTPDYLRSTGIMQRIYTAQNAEAVIQ